MLNLQVLGSADTATFAQRNRYLIYAVLTLSARDEHTSQLVGHSELTPWEKLLLLERDSIA